MNVNNINIQNQPNRGITSGGSSNNQNSTYRKVQMIPSSNGGGGSTSNIISNPYNSSSHVVGSTGTPQLYFSNTSTPPLQGYVVQLQSSGESTPIPVFVPPVTLNNTTISNMSQRNVVTDLRQHQQQHQGGSVRVSVPSGSELQGERVNVSTTDTSHLLYSQNQSSKQDSDQLISQLAIIQAYTPQGHVRHGSQTLPYQTGFNPHVLHQANNQTTQLDTQQLVRFQLYNVGQLLRSHSHRHQARPENLRMMPAHGTVNRSHSTLSFADQQRNINMINQQGSYHGVANSFPGGYKTNELSSLNKQIQNQQIVHSNSFSSAQASPSNSQQKLLSTTASGVGIQQRNQRIMGPQMIRHITNDQHQLSPLMINSTTNARLSDQPFISLKAPPSQQLNTVSGPVNLHQQVGDNKRMQRIINIQRTPDGIRLQTLNSEMQPLMEIMPHAPNAHLKHLNLPPTSNSGPQMGIYPTAPLQQQMFSQASSLPVPISNHVNRSQMGIRQRDPGFQTRPHQGFCYSNPAQTINPQPVHQQLTSSLLSQTQALQYDCKSPPDDAILQETVTQLPVPELIDISSPLSKCSKAEAETLVQHSVPGTTFYKPCIFRKTLPVGTTSDKLQHVTKTKTRERKQLVSNHTTASGTLTLTKPNQDLPKMEKSVRRRKQPLKTSQPEHEADPNEEVGPLASAEQLPQIIPPTANTSEKKKPIAKKSRKSAAGASPKNVPVADMNESNEPLVDLTANMDTLTPKSRKRPEKALNHDVIIVRESNQLNIKKSVATTCAPKPKRRKKATSDECKGSKSTKGQTKKVSTINDIPSEKSVVDLDLHDKPGCNENVQGSIDIKMPVQKKLEDFNNAGKLCEPPEDTSNADWEISFDQAVKCVIKGAVASNVKVAPIGLGKLSMDNFNPTIGALNAIRNDLNATRLRCVSPKVKLTINKTYNQRGGVLVFDVAVLGEGYVDYPEVKVQLTIDYPAEVPVFLDLSTTSASIENSESKRKFEHAISLLRAKLVTISDHSYNLPNIIKIWSQALKFVTFTNHIVPLKTEDRDERFLQSLMM